jgi:hypothetical protein
MYYCTTDRGLCLVICHLISLNPEIEIVSLSVNKLKNETDEFQKYDMDVSLDEVENKEDSIKLKFKFTLLSNPTNIKLSVDGFVSIHGNEAVISKFLTPDQKNIPAVVNTTYQDLFPLLYIISKGMDIPCPAYRLSEISSRKPADAETSQPEDVIEPMSGSDSSELTDDANLQNESKEALEESTLEKPVIEQKM